jgi:endonuclease-3
VAAKKRPKTRAETAKTARASKARAASSAVGTFEFESARRRAEAKAGVRVAPVERAPRIKKPTREHALAVYRVLQERHPDAHCELDHRNPFELIIATVLSAQSTDVMVNKITPELFRRWPGPHELASAPTEAVQQVLSKIGMFRQKTRNVQGLSRLLVERHAGEVPRTLDELVTLPGVGRKTANVVLGVAFGAPEGVVVDTHVQRLSQRLGLTREAEPPGVERDLMRLYPREVWDPLSHTLIFHGRRICTARKPACAVCPANTICPSAYRAELVGRKPPRVRT